MDQKDLQGRMAFLAETDASLDRGDFDTAMALARLRLQERPGDPDARIAVGRILVRQERLDEAWEMLRDLEQDLAVLSQLHVLRGDICLKRGAPLEAKVHYGRFLELCPDAPGSQEVSDKLRTLEHPGEDGQPSGEDTAVVPSDFQTVTLAELYVRQGHLDQAVEVLETILRNDPGHEKAAAMLLDLRKGSGQEDSAQVRAGVVEQLSRWLDNVQRMRSRA
ncbi:MAG: tetratricopeptide repeat protein [Deltaproteobacteria bacterium]|nr:tetratricopeptide repeat protein [Deltaproteobacteria bacterium]